MNKKELITEISVKAETTKGEAARLLDIMIDCITEGLVTDNKVAIMGFGTIEVKDKAERNCINPKTKEMMVAPAGKRIGFKASPVLKEAVAGKE